MSTVNKKEIEKFEKLASEWWNPNGKLKPLHKFNPFRIKFIKEKLISHFNIDNESNAPFGTLKILDIGCGGGLLSEPFTRLGAKITGLDASQKNISVAKVHAQMMNLKIDYQVGTIEKINFNNQFDVILNMEVVEHVSNIDLFIESCSKTLKKNGIMFVTTINRTLKSYLQAIIGAEYILRWLPIGTHDWNKFITPSELQKISDKYNLTKLDLYGMQFNIITGKWKKTNDNSVNYILILKKN